MSKKHSTERKRDPVGLAEDIAIKSAANLKSIPAKKVPNLTDKLDCKRRIATGYYRSKRRGFNTGNEIEDYLEAK